MDILLLGFFVVLFTIFLSKTILEYKNYKGTVYTAIYSGFFEYLMQLRVKKNMTTSRWLSQEVGTHRIVFNSYLDENHKPVYQFITIFSTKGINVFSVMDAKGNIKGKDNDKYWINRKNDKSFRVANPSVMLGKHIDYIKELTGDDNCTGSILFAKGTDFSEVKSSYLVDSYDHIVDIIKANKQSLSEQQILQYFENCTKKYNEGNL